MNLCKKYVDLLPPETLEELRQVSGAVDQLDYIYQACERAGQKMYLIYAIFLEPFILRHEVNSCFFCINLFQCQYFRLADVVLLNCNLLLYHLA